MTAPPPPAPEAVVLQVEQARCRMLVERDLAGLAALLDDDLVYVHSTGLVQDKAAFLEFAANSVAYRQVDRERLRIVSQGGPIVVCTGLLRLAGVRLASQEPFSSVSFVTQVWRCRQDRWALQVFHSTKLPASAGG